MERTENDMTSSPCTGPCGRRRFDSLEWSAAWEWKMGPHLVFCRKPLIPVFWGCLQCWKHLLLDTTFWLPRSRLDELFLVLKFNFGTIPSRWFIPTLNLPLTLLVVILHPLATSEQSPTWLLPSTLTWPEHWNLNFLGTHLTVIRWGTTLLPTTPLTH